MQNVKKKIKIRNGKKDKKKKRKSRNSRVVVEVLMHFSHKADRQNSSLNAK